MLAPSTKRAQKKRVRRLSFSMCLLVYELKFEVYACVGSFRIFCLEFVVLTRQDSV